MGNTYSSRFRVTPRPAAEIGALPIAQVIDIEVDADGWIRQWFGDEQPLQPELCLSHALQELDLGTPDAIVDFLRRHGFIAHRVPFSPFDFDPPSDAKRHDTVIHWRQAAQYLRQARAAATHWATAMQWPGDEARLLSVWRDQGLDVGGEREAEDAWFTFAEVMTRGLTWSHARVEVSVLAEPDRVLLFNRPRPALYEALVAQVFDLVVLDVPPKQCPECGRDFAQQRGRAIAGQNRSKGVVYCSTQCGNRVRQRRYRARRKTTEG